jgi:hypothetical protein
MAWPMQDDTYLEGTSMDHYVEAQILQTCIQEPFHDPHLAGQLRSVYTRFLLMPACLPSHSTTRSSACKWIVESKQDLTVCFPLEGR